MHSQTYFNVGWTKRRLKLKEKYVKSRGDRVDYDHGSSRYAVAVKRDFLEAGLSVKGRCGTCFMRV